MPLPRTTTFLGALAALILLLTALSVAPDIDVPEALLPSIGWFGSIELLGILSLLATVVLAILLLTQTSRR